MAAPGWAVARSGRRFLQARGWLGWPPARAATAGPGSQWLAAARHDDLAGVEVGRRRGIGEWGFYPGVNDRWDPGAWVQPSGYRGVGRK